jgi:hypothetical protein
VATGEDVGRAPVPVRFPADVWEEEVGRLRPRSPMREAAEAGRASLEAERSVPGWMACEPEGPGGIRLPRCVKLYLPLGHEPSAAPYGFVFELIASREPERRFSLRLLAFGERHPRAGVRSVYERAHKRLHGCYPDQA